MEEIEKNGIQIYPLPDCDDDEDQEYKEQCKQLKVRVLLSMGLLIVIFLLFSLIRLLICFLITFVS